MPQIDPVYTCWFPLGQTFHSYPQGGFWNEYGSYLGVIVRWKNNLLFPLDFLLLITQHNDEMSSTHLFILPILKTNSKTLLPQHILDKSRNILYHPSTSPHPWLLLHFPNLGCNYWPHPNIILTSPFILFLLHICANRWVHGSWGGVRRDVLEVII